MLNKATLKRIFNLAEPEIETWLLIGNSNDKYMKYRLEKQLST